MEVSRDSEVKIGEKCFKKYLSKEAIRSRIQELGKELATDFHDQYPLFVVVLNGAFMFAADLVRSFAFPCELQFVKLSSYEGTRSTGQVKKILGLTAGSIDGRHVIIIEDIIDTGRTMQNMMAELLQQRPASIHVATLLLKPSSLQYPITSPYVGFEIPDDFVIGYGLDLDGRARNLEDIYQQVG